MKKLMIAAAVVCVAVMSQAATVAWQNDWAYAINQDHTTYADESLLTGSYLILLGDAAADVTVMNDGTIEFDTDKFSQVQSGTFDYNTFGSTDLKLAASNNGKYLTMICFSTDYQIDGNNIYGVASVELSGAVENPPTDFIPPVFTNDGTGYFVLNQAAQDIPEPTTFALIGVAAAALALRKRFMKK